VSFTFISRKLITFLLYQYSFPVPSAASMSSEGKRTPGEVADALEAASKKLASLAESVRSGQVSLESDIQARTEAIKTTKSALAAVQLPTDGFIDMIVSLCNLLVSRLFMKWKVFENIPSDQAISYEDLAAKVGAEPALISMYYPPLPRFHSYRLVSKAGAWHRAIRLDAGRHGCP